MKIVSFSLWGNDEFFVAGAVANAKLVPEIYPGWVAKFYCAYDVSLANIARLTETGADMQTVAVARSPWEGLFWRFRPIFDKQVTHTIIRDCDSRVNPREAAAVSEWLATDKTLHVMRDHIEHTMPIMGGMWGCKHWPQLEKLLAAWPENKIKGDDQRFLAKEVWPLLARDAVTHDKWPDGTDYDISATDPVYKVFKYRPIEFHGPHDIHAFPPHASFDTSIYGEHVGARIGRV